MFLGARACLSSLVISLLRVGSLLWSCSRSRRHGRPRWRHVGVRSTTTHAYTCKQTCSIVHMCPWPYTGRYLIFIIFLQSIAGEYMFLGNRVVLSRSVAPFTSLPPVVDCSSVKVNPDSSKSKIFGIFLADNSFELILDNCRGFFWSWGSGL